MYFYLKHWTKDHNSFRHVLLHINSFHSQKYDNSEEFYQNRKEMLSAQESANKQHVPYNNMNLPAYEK